MSNKESFEKLPAVVETIEKFVEAEYAAGLKNIFFVGTGGTYSYGLPMEYWAKQMTDMPVYCEMAPELVKMNHKQLGKGSLCIWASATGNTKDILKAMEYTHSKGAKNIAFVQAEESPMKPLSDEFVNVPGDITNICMMITMLKAFNLRGEYDQYAKFVKQVEGIGEALDKAAELVNSRCIYYAARNHNAAFHYSVGAGATYASAYCWGMCVMEEMQWMHTKIIDAAEFFHGAIELCEKDTPCILMKGEDGGRALVDRVEEFLKPLTKEIIVFDTKEVELPVDAEFRPILSSVVMDSMIYMMSKPFQVENNHDLKVRRYYRQMEY